MVNFFEILVNEVLFKLLKYSFPAPPLPSGDPGCDTKIFDLAKSVHWIVDESICAGDASTGVKRRRMLPGGDDSDEEAPAVAPPINDIYRLRQQKRFSK